MSLFLLCSLSVLVFVRALRGRWIADDACIHPDGQFHFEVNSYAQSIWGFLIHPRCMTGLVHTWIYRGFGYWLPAWHGANLVFHVLNSILLYTILVPWLGPDRILLAVAVFALHPLQVPSVCYISARAGMQSMCFAMMAILCLMNGSVLFAVLAQVLAQKSKQDAWGYLIFWPGVL